jgi:hypothetical protein
VTTAVKIEPTGHPVLVKTVDRYTDGEGRQYTATTEVVLRPADPPYTTYATTSRTVEVVDIDPADPRAQ